MAGNNESGHNSDRIGNPYAALKLDHMFLLDTI
jgi:hypothetical protein